eukprot:m.153256 g.153256  ORF g.153256 m.153256 type:complete len:125 (-) comp16230_c1_seq1:2382-2756(-)
MCRPTLSTTANAKPTVHLPSLSLAAVTIAATATVMSPGAFNTGISSFTTQQALSLQQNKGSTPEQAMLEAMTPPSTRHCSQATKRQFNKGEWRAASPQAVERHWVAQPAAAGWRQSRPKKADLL